MRWLSFCVCLSALLFVGCRRPGPVEVHPVSGRVEYDGKPASGVNVFFFPMDAPGVPEIPANPRAVTGPNGEFTLTTYQDADGAPAGGYRVVLLWPSEPQTKNDPESRVDRLMGWYDAAHTTIEARVAAGGTTLPPYKLARVSGPPPESQGIPGRN